MVIKWAKSNEWDVVECQFARKYENGPFIFAGRSALIFYVTLEDSERKRRACWLNYGAPFLASVKRNPDVLWISEWSPPVGSALEKPSDRA